MFPKFKKLKKNHQLLASLVIAIGIIGIWRGIWRLLDQYFFPDDYFISSIIPLIIGIIILAITHSRLTR